MKQIKNKLNKIDKKVDNIQYNCLLVLLPFLVIIIGLLIGNVILTSDLYEQYYIEEECDRNDK